jgi:hypothetical protein
MATGTASPTVTAATPTTTVTVTPGAKVTICHRTNSPTNPYVMITVAQAAIPAHQAHGDVIPAPAGGCSQITPTPQSGGQPGSNQGENHGQQNRPDKPPKGGGNR